MKTYTRDAVNEIYLMLNEPRAYAAQLLMEQRDLLHATQQDQEQIQAGFHQFTHDELERRKAQTRALVAGYEEQASQIPPATARYVEKKYCRTREYPNGAGVVLGVGISLMFWGFCMAVYYFGPMIWRVL